MHRYMLIAFLIAFGTQGAAAQGTSQSMQSGQRPVRAPSATGGVATQPSNSPFKDPLTQGVPPARSVNPSTNSGQTNVPMKAN